jgi:hypothetical protein
MNLFMVVELSLSLYISMMGMYFTIEYFEKKKTKK